jgi:alpha-tubulin suppressor-like RCC1 family protein
LNNVEKVTLGTNHTIALKETSPGSNTYTFYGMGDNQFGQVGVERNIVGFSGVQSWTQISSSHLGSHVAAIRADGLLFTWGSNLSGQLGDGTRIARSSPVQIGNDSWTQVSAGGENTAAIRSDGRLFTWGTSLDGLLTDVPLGSDAFSRSSPVQVNPAGISFYKSISIGSNHALAIASDDRLIAWGVNSFGQLGNGVVQTLAVPQQIGTSSWTQVSAGASFSAAISSDGRLFTWGINSSGQLGDNTIVSKSSPVQIGTSSWTQVSAGNPQTAAIRLDGILFMWGNNIEGELGDNTIVSKSSPVQIGTSSWKQVVTGTARTIAIRSDDTLWGWGRYGGLESTTYVQRNSSPVQISANSTFSNINLQGTSTIGAISSDGKLYIAASNGGTGTNGDGTTLSRNTLSVLGYESDGSPIYSENTTTIYAPTLGANSNNWTSVVAGTNYTYGLKTD